jgi:hypothetical protein
LDAGICWAGREFVKIDRQTGSLTAFVGDVDAHFAGAK